MKITDLLDGINILEKINFHSAKPVKKITSDSRLIEEGDVFVACPGARMDGHDFIGQAIVARAGVILYENDPDLIFPKHITGLKVKDSQAALAVMLNHFHHHPDRKVKLIGVTGTNGKTTIAYLLHKLLRERSSAAYLGTLWYETGHQKMPAPNTTPGAEVLIPLMEEMAKEKVQHCVMEVSSHALDQKRVFGLQYELGIFTQLTQDHLDYHKDMEGYFEAKRLFFANHPQPRHMLINRDCPYGQRLLEEFPQAKSFSLFHPAHYQAVQIEPSFQGSRFLLRYKDREVPFQIRLPMMHNISNISAILASLDILGYDPEDFRGVLQEIPGVPGRLERVMGVNDFQVFVDYAHTPDAVENVLREARKLKPHRIITVIGCGGDRDRSKRPIMGRMAAHYSDLVILTSDNPRSEEPQSIIDDIKKGISQNDLSSKVQTFLDRHLAIEKALALAVPGDVVFVLGKGHEDYQILGDQKLPFDDRLVVQECLSRKSRVFFS